MFNTSLRRSVRAELAERTGPLPGDELIPAAIDQMTHALTIRRSEHDIWQWLVQMGAGRAGWYSYDRIDNGGVPSADHIRPELQHIEVGAVMPALPGATDGFIVVRVDPERSLTLAWPRPGGGYTVTWTFVLERRDSDSTRLVVRVRAAGGYRFLGFPAWVSTPIARVVHFIMERKQMLGIAARAEAHAT